MTQNPKDLSQHTLRESDLHWSISLLTKMTGVVLWTLMLLMFLLALLTIHKQSVELKAHVLSAGKVKLQHLQERYDEFIHFEATMNQLLKKELASISATGSATETERLFQSLIEQDRVRLEQSIRQHELTEETAGIVLVTSEGKHYSTAGEPDVTDFLTKKCRSLLTAPPGQPGPLLQEYDHLYTLSLPVISATNTPSAVIAVALSKDLLRHRMAKMRKEVFLIITIIVLLLSFPIIYFLQRWVVQPIRDVSDASKEISDGNFDKRIPVKSHDEIGLLAKNFNKMAASLTFRDERLSRSYDKIQTLKDYYDSIVSNAPVGIMTLDQDGIVAFENPLLCEMFYTFKEHSRSSYGRQLQDIPVLQNTGISAVFSKIMAGNIVEEQEFLVTRPSGEEMVLSLKGVPLLNENHFIQGSLLIFTDITKRTGLEARIKKTNEILERTVQERTEEILKTNKKLKQTVDDLYKTNRQLLKTSEALKDSNEIVVEANRMKTEFLASMSHELRTPLNAIIGFSDLILSGIEGPTNEKQREDLQAISRSGKNLLHLINDILDLSKIEAGKIRLKKKVIDIHALLSEISPMVKNVIGGKPVEFRTHVGEGVRYFYADDKKILQVLINLIGNAVKFTDTGEISLSITRKAPENGGAEEVLEFTVSDTGIGIREQDYQSIFNEFTQIDQSSRNESGSGLGLSITKKLVELGGGKIWVEGQHREGAHFHFTVPILSENITPSVPDLAKTSPKKLRSTS